MRVVFFSPNYPAEMVHFTRGLKEVGAEIYGVAETPKDGLPPSVKAHLSGYLQVPRIMDEDDVMDRVSAWLRGTTIDRVLANWEPLTILAARLRERWSLPGMSVDTVHAFRDKVVMKERVAKAGLRVPKSRRAQSEHEIRAAAEELGYPICVKPIAGAGSADTHKVRDASELDAVLKLIRHVPECSVEEFIEGEEFTYDTVSVDGVPGYENVAQYLPKPIEMRSQQWISPVIITVKDMYQPKLMPGVTLGRGVLKALNMGDGFTHMEWFLTPKGEAVFGEIGCRAPGGHLVDQMNYSNDVDLFREWARAVCWKSVENVGPRRYNCGIIFKRAQGEGRITRIEGLQRWKQMAGRAFVDDQLLRPGAMRRNWMQTLVSDGFVVCRHPDWSEAFRLSMAAATDIKLYAA